MHEQILIITGAGNGIGRATALAFAAAGTTLVLAVAAQNGDRSPVCAGS